MADKTGIAWASHTASPWHGCAHATYTDANGNEHAHQGCLNCYAEKMAPRNPGTLGVWGKGGKRVMSASFHANCRRWNKAAEKAGVRASVFPSICDIFEQWDGPIFHGTDPVDGVPMQLYRFEGGYSSHRSTAIICLPPVTMSDLRRDLFSTIDACPWLTFLLLTKRPQNVLGMWPERRSWPSGVEIDPEHIIHSFRPNVHLLASISTQADADVMIQHLLKCRDLVPVLGVSAEPLLGDVDIEPFLQYEPFHENYKMTFGPNEWRGLDWLIIGNESRGKGVGRLPGGTEAGYWKAAKSLIEQCRQAGVAVFHKQGPVDGKTSHDPSEWPAWARVQEFPKVGRI